LQVIDELKPSLKSLTINSEVNKKILESLENSDCIEKISFSDVTQASLPFVISFLEKNKTLQSLPITSQEKVDRTESRILVS